MVLGKKPHIISHPHLRVESLTSMHESWDPRILDQSPTNCMTLPASLTCLIFVVNARYGNHSPHRILGSSPTNCMTFLASLICLIFIDPQQFSISLFLAIINFEANRDAPLPHGEHTLIPLHQ